MSPNHLELLLADDDEDDCLFFKEALRELPVSMNLTTVNNGEELMALLKKDSPKLPYVLFLDLNMPRKSGFECLTEIKHDENLKRLPVVILSTSFEQIMADQLYEKGASSCFRKPADFSQLSRIIQQALSLLAPATTLPDAGKTYVR
ncbi:response regulator [Spirosoma aerophilum]